MIEKNLLWTEKYRPQNLDGLILPDRIKNKLKQGVYQNMLFYSGPGKGKTSAAFILAKSNPHIYINCSLETGVDVVRNRITEFCSTLSIMDGENKMKIVILDEFDGVSDQYMKALRGTIEKFHKSARFIATCNYYNKIPDNIRSRFENISFDFDETENIEMEKEYFKRVYEILTKENMKVSKNALIELVRRKYPDMRSIITTLQGYYAQGITDIKLEDVLKFNSIYKDLYEFIFDNTKNEVDTYQYIVSKYSDSIDDVINSLGIEFIEYIKQEQPLHINKIGSLMYAVNRHSYELNFVIDKVVTLLSLIYTLKNTIHGR